jgi:hypothetical protein
MILAEKHGKMSNWRKNTSLLIIIVLSLAGLAKRAAIAESFSRMQERLPLVVAQNWRACQRMGENIEEIHAFETQNYYINICRQEQQYFYYRQSKSNSDSFIWLPAQKVFDGKIYQAIGSNITYFVGSNSDGYYSSVMHNNSEIIFEPQIYSQSTAEQDISNSPTATPASNNYQLKLENYDRGQNNWQVCTENQGDSHPRLNGWQQFIGQPVEAVSQYATNNGHNFTYSDRTSNEALVNTKDGLKVILNVSNLQSTIGSICVNPIADT